MQSFTDEETNENFHICYDVSGESHQAIFFLEDRMIGTKIEGILLGDYYLHQMKIHREEEILTVKRTSFEYNGKTYKWLENGRIILDKFIINTKNVLAEITIINKKDELKIIVKKIQNEFGVWHLDINFKNLNLKENINLNNKRFGGIIGDIANRNISLLKENTVKIDNKRIINGKLKKRKNFDCILLPFENLIQPKTKNYYVYFQSL